MENLLNSKLKVNKFKFAIFILMMVLSLMDNGADDRCKRKS